MLPFLGLCLFVMTGTVFSLTAVQEERQRVKEKGEGEVESTSSANSDMPVEKVLEAELAVEPKTDTYIDAQVMLSFRFLLTCTLNSGAFYFKNTIRHNTAIRAR